VLTAGGSHPGEDIQLYTRHRIATLFGYGHDASFIAEHIGLDVNTVRKVVAEEAEYIELERGVEREW